MMGRPAFPEPLTDLIKDCDDGLRRFLATRIPADAVEDVAQDVWLSVWEGRGQYRERQRFRAYLRTVAARRAADWHRAHTDPVPLPELDIPAWDAPPDLAENLLLASAIQPTDLLWGRVVEDLPLADSQHGMVFRWAR
jgi:DNA-directed RNA polymerase specialized sigma24 family protein